MPRRVLLLSILLLSLACNLPQMTSTPGATSPRAPTRAPTHTPTPSPSPSTTPPPTPTIGLGDLEDQAAAMRPAFAADVRALPGLTRYYIDVHVELDAALEEARIEGVERILFTNPLNRPLEDLVLMLWPNQADQYVGEMTAGPAIVSGEVITPEAEEGGLALRLSLPRPLQPAQTLDLTVPFRVEEIASMSASSPRRFAVTEGVLLAPTFYPLIPRLVDGEWQTEDAPPGGDTTNSDTAFYVVHITASAEHALAASGAEIERQENGDGTFSATYVSGPVRDFALALGPLQLTERDVDGVRLRTWILAPHAADTSRLLIAAALQLRTLTARVGPYPYAELDIVDAPGAFGGIEYPGLVYVGSVGTQVMIEPLVHEIGHQWFYALIGNDQLLAPWLDEAAASYSEVLYYEAALGSSRATTALGEFRQIVTSFASDPGLPIGLPVGEYSSESDYAVIVYAKGALFFDALRRRIGDQAFFDFLHLYLETHRYGFAGPQDFQLAAETACTCDLDSLFDLWVYEGGPLPGP